MEAWCGFATCGGQWVVLYFYPDHTPGWTVERDGYDLFGAWRPALFRRDVIYARRCTFIIDPDGRVAKRYA